MKIVRWGLGVALGFSLLLTLSIVIWEVVENPGEIFRTEAGIAWHHVWETALSWFLPTFPLAAPIGVLMTWLVLRFGNPDNPVQ